MEIWKSVVGYEGFYEVSDMGNVRGLDRVVSRGAVAMKRKGKMMNFSLHHKGYRKASLSKVENGISKQRAFFVHRLVASAFIENPNYKNQVNHIDGNKLNNCVENLEWVTNQENIDHAKRNNLLNKVNGEKHGMSKLSSETVKDIKMRLNLSQSNKMIAAIYGIDPTTVSDIKRGRTWKHIKA